MVEQSRRVTRPPSLQAGLCTLAVAFFDAARPTLSLYLLLPLQTALTLTLPSGLAFAVGCAVPALASTLGS